MIAATISISGLDNFFPAGLVYIVGKKCHEIIHLATFLQNVY